MLHGNFITDEYTLTYRLRASSTRSAWRMRTQRHSSPGKIPSTSHQNEQNTTLLGGVVLVSHSRAKSNSYIGHLVRALTQAKNKSYISLYAIFAKKVNSLTKNNFRKICFLNG